MTIATQKYNTRGSTMFNHFSLYLQIILIMDLLLYDRNEIHPSY
jgi:hypothetical protein